MGVIAPHRGSHPEGIPMVQLGPRSHSGASTEPTYTTSPRGSPKNSPKNSRAGVIPGVVAGVVPLIMTGPGAPAERRSPDATTDH